VPRGRYTPGLCSSMLPRADRLACDASFDPDLDCCVVVVDVEGHFLCFVDGAHFASLPFMYADIPVSGSQRAAKVNLELGVRVEAGTVVRFALVASTGRSGLEEVVQ